MPSGSPIDREALHKIIWEASDRRNHKIKIVQKDFAVFYGIAVTHMSRLIKEFEKEGRLKKVGARYRNVGVYVVRDPDTFNLEQPPQPTGLQSAV